MIGLDNAGTITPRFDAAYRGDIFSNATNAPTNLIEDYIIANARLTWRNYEEDLSIALEVTDLFDKYYYSRAST